MIEGKLEVVVKINELPESKIVENNWVQFQVNCGDASGGKQRIITATVKPKVWKKLTDAQANYPQWVGAIAGTLGQQTADGFILENPNIQVFERKPKPEA